MEPSETKEILKNINIGLKTTFENILRNLSSKASFRRQRTTTITVKAMM